MTAVEDILDFWFGELDSEGLAAPERHALWFRADDSTDSLCRDRFGDLLARARRGELDYWASDERGLVALVVLLDQFSRNIHRGTAEAFAADARALSLATGAIDAGRHLALPRIHRVFLYLPLEHAEDLAVQERCVALFDSLAEGGPRALQDYPRYARAHRDVIARFGRFPHRNALLQRTSTPAEIEYLAHNAGF